MPLWYLATVVINICKFLINC